MPPFRYAAVVDAARRFPPARYRNVLRDQFSEELAQAAALAEATSEHFTPFALSARKVSEFVYGDSTRYSEAGQLIRQLVDCGFIRQSSRGDEDARLAAEYTIPPHALKKLVPDQNLREDS